MLNGNISGRKKDMKPDEIYQAIASMPDRIRQFTTLKKIPPKHPIVQKGEPADHIYLLTQGSVRVMNEFASGHRYSFAKMAAPNIIGEYEILSEHNEIASTNETISECTVISMPRRIFIDWIRSDATLGLLLARIIAEKGWDSSDKQGMVKYLSGEAKLKSYFVSIMQETIDDPHLIREDRQRIADEIGTSVKTVNRSIQKLKEAGLLDLKHGKVLMTQAQAAKLAEEMECEI